MHRVVENLGSLALLIVFLAFAVATTGGDSVDEDVRAAVPAFTVSASKLFVDYDRNELKADGRYTGTVFTVTGRVKSISKDITGTPYLILKTREHRGVQASFSDGHSEKLRGLRKGAAVRLTCMGKGKVLNVLLGGCIFAR